MAQQLHDSKDLLSELSEARQHIAELEARLRLSQPSPLLTDNPLWQEALLGSNLLINSTSELIWVVDADKQLVLANDAARESFRTSFQVEMQAAMTSAELAPAERAEYYDLLYDKALSGQSLKVNLNGPNKNTYAVTIQPVKQAGEIIGASIFAREITEQHQQQQELRFFKQIIESTPDMVSVVDRNYCYYIVNDAYLNKLNLRREDIIGKTVRSLIGDEAFRAVAAPCLGKAFAGEVVHTEVWVDYPNIGPRYMAVTYHPLHGQELPPKFVAVDARDMTALKRAEEDRQRIFDVSLDMLCVVDFNGTFRALNPAWTQTLGWSLDELENTPLLKLVSAEDRQSTINAIRTLLTGHPLVGFENRCICKDGSERWLSWNSFPDLEQQRIFSVIRDITTQKDLVNELRKLATTDPLTGASNRRHFIERSAAELKRSRRYGTPLAVFMLDIDYFKQVNDSYGHDAGDEVLVKLVECCLRELRETDVFGRFGGEEFAAVLVGTNEEEALNTCQRVREQVEQLRIKTRQGDIKISASIGLTMFCADDFSINPLLKRADDALYRAKNRGRNQIVTR